MLLPYTILLGLAINGLTIQNTKGPAINWAFGKIHTSGTGGIRTLVQT